MTNTVISGIQHRSEIIRNDISNNFSIAFVLNTWEKCNLEDNAQFIYKCIYGEEEIELFKHVEWNNIIKKLENPNPVYKSFFNKYLKRITNIFLEIKLK